LASVEKAITEMPGAFVEHLLRRLLCTGSAAAVVLHQELDVGVVEFRQRHLGGIAHGLRRHRRVAAARQGQDEPGLDLAFPDIARGLRGRAGRGAGEIAHARAAGQQEEGRQGGQPRRWHARGPRPPGLPDCEHMGRSPRDDGASCRRQSTPAIDIFAANR
jgi:hypothetical protein